MLFSLINQLKRQVDSPILLNVRFGNWHDIFVYLSDIFNNRKHKRRKFILVLDEIQWMAAGRRKLISLIKYFWDNEWKSNHVMLILCGSIASFMVKNVIRSKALYGRITYEINLIILSFLSFIGR